ncbi:MAG: 50S ribosomal protein L29 [Candidatus Omnitrophica bacterium]|nr:50S ribosomal protein L29 [Candidatus Omnitrophota bacterium]
MDKKIKAKDLVGLSRSELLDKEKALKDELFKLNGERYSGRVEKPHMFSLVKRELSIVATILNTKKEK